MAKKKDKVLTLEFFRKQGSLGGKIGGVKASENMTAEERKARAMKAVAARKWHPLLTEEEKAARASKPRGKVGRPKKVVVDPTPPKPVGRPRRVVG
jgi:hypothetical protein